MSVDCAGRHVCEPTEWPTSIEDAWTCPECLALHRSFRIGDEPRAASLPGVNHDDFGWKRA